MKFLEKIIRLIKSFWIYKNLHFKGSENECAEVAIRIPQSGIIFKFKTSTISSVKEKNAIYLEGITNVEKEIEQCGPE